MLNLFQRFDLPSISTLFDQINADMGGNGQVWVIVICACLMLVVHAVAVLGIAGAFHSVDNFMTRSRIFGATFLSYFIAIFWPSPSILLKSSYGLTSALN